MLSDADKIRAAADVRGISRLCHFTPSRTLIKIARGRVGILSAKRVAIENPDVFNPTDKMRYDGRPGHVCCSIEFPNTFYLNQVKNQDPAFTDWSVILIKPVYLWLNGTEFCPVNAAKGRGCYSKPGFAAFQELYAAKPSGSQWARSAKHRPACPTDMQAEVLVPDSIAISDVIGIGFPSEAAAREERTRWKIAKVPEPYPPFLVCAHFFDALALRNIVRLGHPFIETPFA